ncbi:LOW QUALITY PROTEIN: sex-regulated protein janus-A [Drosophila sulfurigaster albostrigata]|uniref:LOW QUALITY PROTEIN: sex-regulated protein janus-A n=1 Tax=Drosophila sulfurigaster albostrigata TaxID=89887 RepID=UPI002D21AED2|nr:LOW QUALITY PROTEIN: sex-regulated protein janus-A [Drosophila sulfurigaster albostrigata]
MTEESLKAVPLVDIDDCGIFKYVLIKIFGNETGEGKEPSTTVVRGYADCTWHADIYERVQEIVKKGSLDTECLGGGRIEHNPDKKYIKIYGYSQGFGKADHLESKRILQTKYKDYEIEASDEGY